MFGGRILNNSHRGDLVEMMVAMALGPDWQFVGLGWHPWDFQRGWGEDRIRIQVKQSAALQLWGPTKSPIVSLNWSSSPPSYFEEYNPGEQIESEGYFCEIFVIGIHPVKDAEVADQCDPKQWLFSVIPAKALKAGSQSIGLRRIIDTWPPVVWGSLKSVVSAELQRLA